MVTGRHSVSKWRAWACVLVLGAGCALGCAHASAEHRTLATTTTTFASSPSALSASAKVIDAYVAVDPIRDVRKRDLLLAARDLTSLSPLQRGEIDGLLERRRATHEAARAAQRAFVLALSEAWSSDPFDRTTLTAAMDALVAAVRADESRSRWGLEALHAVLTPAQRVILVTDAQSLRGATDDHVALTGPTAPFAPLLRELGMTATQADEIETNRRRLERSFSDGEGAAERQEHDRLLEAFKATTFVMDQLAPSTGGQSLRQRLEHVVAVAAAVAPVLTEPQRKASAAALRFVATE